MISATIPLRVVSEANERGHWSKKAKRAKVQRMTVGLVVGGHVAHHGKPSLPCTVVLTRVAPSSGLDTDNLARSLKAVRDAVADAIGIDDRDPRVAWLYAQRRGKPKEWAVEIRIEPRVDECGQVFQRLADGAEVVCVLPTGHACAHAWSWRAG